MKTSKFLGLLLVAFLILIEIVTMTSDKVKAASSMDALNEQNAGLSTAPDNLGLDQTLFTRGDFSEYLNSDGKAISNMANLMNSNGGFSGDLRAIRMTYNTNQAGAIWSNVAGGNYIDITKKQTLSMWLYFGPTTHKNTSESFGDGMAFVLQNSSQGTSAFSHKGTTLGVGETLGVWGVDNDLTVSDPQTIANTAISKSWALEFDTHTNSSGSPGFADGFDKGITGSHIAYGYPGDPNTYTRMGSKPIYGILGTLLSGGYYYQQKHSGTMPVTLHDGKWHHLTVSWDPVTFQATYSFNDKNPDGSKGKNPLNITTDPIDRTKFGVVPNNQLRWGFTATTGESYQANLIAFESIPSSVEGEADATITDKTKNKDIVAGDSVNSNDSLTINYNLKYDSGRDAWTNIVAELTLPDNITYNADSNGNVGVITYSDGTIENIPIGELSGTSLKHKLKQELSDSGKTSAVISINGVANSVSSDTSVATQRSTIDSDTLIKNVDTPNFVIKKSKPINLNLDQNNISVGPDKDANITGNVFYTDGTTVTNSDISVYAKLNGKSLDTFKLDNNDASGKLNFKISSDELIEDSNTLEVYVMDSDGNKSTVSTVIIAKTGSLSLTVNKGYQFRDTNNIAASMLIPRKGDWNITVTDGREVGAENVWKLSASTSGLYEDNNAFNGNLVYRNSDGIESSLTGDTPINIANGIKTEEGQQTTNIAQSWNDSEGIFLRSNGLSTAGTYEGKINWTLSDTI